MLTKLACPSSEELTQMLLGRLSASRLAAIEDHLDGCNACLSAIGTLEVESQIVDMLKSKPAAKMPPMRPDLEPLLATLGTLHAGDAEDVSPSSDLPVLLRSDDVDELGRLAHYRVLSQLGAGGMGVVYLANDTKLKRSVALKVLRPKTARDPDARARFLREAQTIASIKHEHVVVVHEVGEAPSGAPSGDDDTIPYLAMELLDGIGLQAWMQEHPRPPILTVVHVGRQIAEALAALHARGLVHRDVKPGNLWLERSRRADGAPSNDLGKLKLLDFGLAATASDALAEAKALGTPAYMAPEQLRGEAVDARSDVFSLGCVLYELCTGEHPFPDRRLTIEHTAPFPAGDVNPRVPVALSRLIARMLRENPAERPESALLVANELKSIEESLIVVSAPPTPQRGNWVVGGIAILTTALAVAFIVRSLLPPETPQVAVAPPKASEPANPPAAPPQKKTPQHDPKTSPPIAPVLVNAPAVDPALEAMCDDVRNFTPSNQWLVVTRHLEKRNPGYNRNNVKVRVEKEGVLRFFERTDFIQDIRPIRCLVDLKTLALSGSEPKSGKLFDLSPIDNLRLHTFDASNNPKLANLTPLRKMPLNNLDVSHTAVASLADLKGMPLVELGLSHTAVKDLSLLRSLLKLNDLRVAGIDLEKLDWIEPLHLKTLDASDNPRLKDVAPLKSTHVAKLNLSGTAVAALDGLPKSVVELRLARTPVKDLTPLQSLRVLRVLDVTGCPLESLRPLTGSLITEIKIDFRIDRDMATLQGLTNLRKINDKSAEEFLQNVVPPTP